MRGKTRSHINVNLLLYPVTCCACKCVSVACIHSWACACLWRLSIVSNTAVSVSTFDLAMSSFSIYILLSALSRLSHAAFIHAWWKTHTHTLVFFLGFHLGVSLCITWVYHFNRWTYSSVSYNSPLLNAFCCCCDIILHNVVFCNSLIFDVTQMTDKQMIRCGNMLNNCIYTHIHV